MFRDQGGDPMELLAVGRSGGHVVIGLDAARSIASVSLDQGLGTLRPRANNVFVYVGNRLPRRFAFKAAGYTGECFFDKQGAPDWWLNCSGSAVSEVPE